MSFIPKPHEIYKHFKGNLYQITAIAEHTETGETLVVYQALYGDFKIYARPLEMFVSKVDKEKYPFAAQEYRFELQGEDADRQKREDYDNIENQAADWGQADNGNTAAEGSKNSAEEGEAILDPILVEFLDADTYEDRLRILTGAQHKITDEMLTTMSLACDIELKAAPLEERFREFMNCLLTLERYECNRLR